MPQCGGCSRRTCYSYIPAMLHCDYLSESLRGWHLLPSMKFPSRRCWTVSRCSSTIPLPVCLSCCCCCSIAKSSWWPSVNFCCLSILGHLTIGSHLKHISYTCTLDTCVFSGFISNVSVMRLLFFFLASQRPCPSRLPQPQDPHRPRRTPTPLLVVGTTVQVQSAKCKHA